MDNSPKEIERLDSIIEDFNVDWGSTSDQRDLANEEYRFIMVPGGQWEGFSEDAYDDRAKMEMNHVGEFVRRTYAQWSTAKQAVNYAPSDGATNDDQADLLDGLIRRDTQQMGGQSAIDTAVWETLQEKILPALINDLPDGYIMRAWVADCSTGEEAYSLAIIFKEVMEKVKSWN